MLLKVNFVRGVFYILLFWGITSCVSNNKVVYIQNNDYGKKDLLKDTILRAYTIDRNDYRIQPRDNVLVSFQSLSPKEFDFLNSNPSFNAQNNQVQGDLVDNNGEITLPFLGKVKVSGFTVFELQDSLQKIALRYFESPTVRVRLLNQRITILGEVTVQGTIPLVENMNMLEVIGRGGGVSELGDRANIKLIRQRDGKASVQYINILKEDFFRSPYYFAQNNDIIIVPPLKQRTLRRYYVTNIGLAASTLSVLFLIYRLSIL